MISAGSRRVEDGGWGWVCALSSAYSFGVTRAFYRTMSLTFFALQQKYQCSATAVAWLFSLASLCKELAFLVTPLCQRFGCRPVAMVGGVLFATGLVLTAFSPYLATAFITYAVMPGMACNIAQACYVLIINEYFDKHRSKATMIVFVGCALGTFIIALVIDYTLKKYGLTFSLIILACIVINQTVTGALLRPAQINRPVRNTANSIQAESKDKNTPPSNYLPTTDDENDHTVQYATTEYTQDIDIKLQEKETLSTSDASSGKVSQRPSSTADSASRSGCCAFMMKYYNVGLLKNPVFVSFILMLSTVAFTAEMANFFMASWANERGVSLKQSAWIIALTSVLEIASRVICGIIFDIRIIREKRKIIFGFITLSACCCVTLFAAAFDTVTVILAYCVARTFISPIWLLESVILADIVTPEKMHGGLAISKTCRLVSPLLVPLLGGLIKDSTGSFDIGFVAAGLIGTAGCLSYLVCLVIEHYQIKKTNRSSGTT